MVSYGPMISYGYIPFLDVLMASLPLSKANSLDKKADEASEALKICRMAQGAGPGRGAGPDLPGLSMASDTQLNRNGHHHWYRSELSYTESK